MGYWAWCEQITVNKTRAGKVWKEYGDRKMETGCMGRVGYLKGDFLTSCLCFFCFILLLDFCLSVLVAMPYFTMPGTWHCRAPWSPWLHLHAGRDFKRKKEKKENYNLLQGDYQASAVSDLQTAQQTPMRWFAGSGEIFHWYPEEKECAYGSYFRAILWFRVCIRRQDWNERGEKGIKRKKRPRLLWF